MRQNYWAHLRAKSTPTRIAAVPTTKRARQKAARREKIEAQRRAAKRRQVQRRVATVVGVVAVVFITAALIASGGSKKPHASTTSSTTTTSGSTTTTKPSGTTTTTVPGVKNVSQSQANQLAVAAGCPHSPTARANTLQFAAAPKMAISQSSNYYAHVVTTAGTIVVKLLPKQAPLTVNNFVFLAKHHFYDCVSFHRVIQGFVIQGGDPTGTGTGGPGYSFNDELPKTATPTYPLYSVAMANSGANTNGSQFFIITGSAGEQLPNQYSLFGQVVSGFAAVKIMDNAAGPPASGVPPAVIHRMLHVTISSKA
jgi:cyclophilin family peptidyl-prolyl cis-trans isomerase